MFEVPSIDLIGDPIYMLLVASFWMAAITALIGVLLVPIMSKDGDSLLVPIGSIIVGFGTLFLCGVAIILYNDPTVSDQNIGYFIVEIIKYILSRPGS